MATYYATDNQHNPLIPVRLLERHGNMVKLEVTATRDTFRRGQVIECDAAAYVKRVGRQRGRFSHYESVYGGRKAVYVYPVDIRRYPE